MCYSMTWKSCLGVLIISVLAWLPQGVTPALTWLSPTLCWAGDAPNPEAIVTISIIKDNYMIENHARNETIISHSFAGFKGLMQINQATGFLNNQVNVVAIPGDLKPWHNKSIVQDTGVDDLGDNHHSCDISGGSFKHGRGIVQINQTSGNMNSQVNAVGLAVKKCTSLSDDKLVELGCKHPFQQGNSDPNNTTNLASDSDPRNKCTNFYGVWNSNQISGDNNSGQTLTQINIIPVHK
jgi:hypothetical protein